MGLMDKVKTQASVLAQKTQETARDIQAKRRADAMLRNLGAAVYAERTGRGTSNTQADIERLINDLKAHEAENGISLAPESADQASSAPGGVPPQGGPSDPGGPSDQGGPSGPPPGETTTQV
jgi:hypothetical protein